MITSEQPVHSIPIFLACKMVYKIFIKEINIFTGGPGCDDIKRNLQINRLACSS